MKSLIIYGSQYGTTKKYAEKFSEIMNIPVVDYKEIKDLSGYDRIIHFGGLYAGGVKGLKHIVRAISKEENLILVTVGLADVCDEENIRNIRQSIRRQVPQDILNRTTIFHLRGGIDYKNLSLKHKTMMTLLYKKVKKIPEDKRSAEVKAMIDTFNSQVDFTDFSSLKQIAEIIQ